MADERPYPWLGAPTERVFYHSDCGHLVGCSDPNYDLTPMRLHRLRGQFDSAIYRAVAKGEGCGHRSSSMLGWTLEDAICLVADEYPNPSEDSLNAAYAAYREQVRFYRSFD